MRLRVAGTRIAVALAIIAAGVLAPRGAGAVTFGGDLNQPANNQYTCGQGAPPLFTFGIGSQSCLWFSGSATASFYAPLSGTVTAVRIKVGPVPGPMQVVVMRSLYQNNAGDPGHPYFACCFVERYGPVFEPQANAVTTVPVNLPMTEEPTPPPQDVTTNAAGDFLALTVLSPSVPVPMFLGPGSISSGTYPAPTAASFPAPSATPLLGFTEVEGAQVLMSADLEVGNGGGGPAPAPGGGGGAPRPPVLAPAIPALGLPATIPLRGNTATFPLRCLVAACNGTLTLQNAQLAGLARASRAAARKRRVVSYGSASFKLAAGTTGKVKVTLNASGRKLLKGHRSVKVWANVRFSSGAGAPKSTRVTLKR
ncbi:MAG TPA: hypothetical protein VF380_07045 [Solirubrobacteraceae bacterium]